MSRASVKALGKYARANARMLINAASKRSSAKNAVRTSRSRSTRMVAETE